MAWYAAMLAYDLSEQPHTTTEASGQSVCRVPTPSVGGCATADIAVASTNIVTRTTANVINKNMRRKVPHLRSSPSLYSRLLVCEQWHAP